MGLRQPQQTERRCLGAASKPCWGENTRVSHTHFPAAFEAGPSQEGLGFPDTSSSREPRLSTPVQVLCAPYRLAVCDQQPLCVCAHTHISRPRGCQHTLQHS